MLRRLVIALFAAATANGIAAEPLLQLTFAAEGSVPAPPWHVVGLPEQTKPFTRFSVVAVAKKHALRVEADKSYGNLVYPLRLNDGTPHLLEPVDIAGGSPEDFGAYIKAEIPKWTAIVKASGAKVD